MSLFFYATADPLTSKCLCMQVRSGAFFILECNVVGHLRPFQKRQPAVITAKLGRDEIGPSLALSA